MMTISALCKASSRALSMAAGSSLTIGRHKGAAPSSSSMVLTKIVLESMICPLCSRLPAGTSSLPVGIKATTGLRNTSTVITPAAASRERSQGVSFVLAGRISSPRVILLPQGLTFIPGVTVSPGSKTRPPSSVNATASIAITLS
ncbi:hypothetical protein SDC9_207073 [bioreactor metagenome]|uniref:Uncharacterized protein n=1 Tax=bioreactor metagenome TaxID=1076179 RepID=A0A645J898_9ZZZZ